MHKLNNKYRQLLFTFLKLLIVVGAFYFIYQKISNNNQLDLLTFKKQIQSIVFQDSVLFFLMLFTLLNWFFEILKWKNLVSSFNKITFLESTKQSLGSLTASLLTPNRIGEYGAKALFFKKTSRKKVLLLNLISNMSQMSITFLFGTVGLTYLFLNYSIDFPNIKSQKLIYLFVLFLILVFGFWFFTSKKLRGFYYDKIIRNIKNLPKIIIIKTFLFSGIRYLIFSHQLYYLLFVFGVDTDYNTLIRLIFATYLLASIIPGLPLFDWLIKGSVAVYIFQFIGISGVVIVSITTIMWLLNFAIPAIIGSYFVLNFKMNYSEEL